MRRVRAVGENAVPNWVAREARKFEYPDFDTIAPPSGPRGGGGAPTVVVAASDATDVSKGKADFICPGVNDAAVFDAALALMSATGGRLLLTEGTFQLGNSTIFTPNQNITIQGMGNNTRVESTSTGTVFEFVGDGSGMRDVLMRGTSQVAPALFVQFDESGWADNVFFNLGAVAFNLQGGGYSIRSCGSDGVPIFVDGSPFGSDVLIEGNGTFDEGHIGRIILGASADNWVIANNVLEGGIEDSGSGTSQVVITGNVWEQVTSINPGHAVIDCGGADIDYLVIANNVIWSGDGNTFLRLSNLVERAIVTGNVTAVNVDDGIVSNGLGLGSIIANNSIDCDGIGISVTGTWESGIIEGNYIQAGEHGISLGGMLQGVVSENLIYRPSLLTTNTFDGIILSGNSDGNLIHGNEVFITSFGNVARYGINISAATCDRNAVYANYLGQTANYGTGDFNDAGTGTLTAPAANGQFVY